MAACRHLCLERLLIGPLLVSSFIGLSPVSGFRFQVSRFKFQVSGLSHACLMLSFALPPRIDRVEPAHARG